MGKLKVKDLLEKGFVVKAGAKAIDKEIESVYICDLLSWVMSHAKNKSAWITIQTHVNIVAVAVLTEISCIIIPENAKLDQEAVIKAEEENIPLLSFSGTSYDAALILNELIK
ncbi:MAG: DRTGG domain-containing protein [Thermoanaerobacteraceae bacterium]